MGNTSCAGYHHLIFSFHEKLTKLNLPTAVCLQYMAAKSQAANRVILCGEICEPSPRNHKHGNMAQTGIINLCTLHRVVIRTTRYFSITSRESSRVSCHTKRIDCRHTGSHCFKHKGVHHFMSNRLFQRRTTSISYNIRSRLEVNMIGIKAQLILQSYLCYLIR